MGKERELEKGLVVVAAVSGEGELYSAKIRDLDTDRPTCQIVQPSPYPLLVREGEENVIFLFLFL